jgi:DNA topoisomerase-2
VPPHHPLDVLEYIRAKLDCRADLPSIRPYARGFVGSFETGEDGYVSVGLARADGPKSVIIEELPLRCWTDKYKAKLLSMKDRGEVLGFTENHTTSRVSFRVDVRRTQLLRMRSTGLERFFKLRSTLATTNMHAFDSENRIQRFDTPQAIADAFFPIRRQLYHDRKSLLESERNHSSTMLRNKARFIEAVTTGKIELVSGKKSKSEASAQLKNLGFATASDLLAIKSDNALAKRRQALDQQGPNESIHNELKEGSSSASSDFDYLLNMPLSSLTVERIIELRKDADRRDEELRHIQATTAEDLWRTDLDSLAATLERYLKG